MRRQGASSWIVDLNTGLCISLHVGKTEGLAGASTRDLADIRITRSGLGLQEKGVRCAPELVAIFPELASHKESPVVEGHLMSDPIHWERIAVLLRSWIVLLFACLSFTQATAEGQNDDQGIADAVRLIRSEAAGHRLILLGEKHGTQQIPRLVAKLVSAYAEQGPVLLGLEVHHSEQAALRRYLASDGGPSARSALQAGPFWNVKGVQHDGRRNYATLDLIEQLRQLRVQGQAIDILPYDNPPNQIADSQKRDKAMAVRLRNAFAALPRGRLLVVSGNVHAMLVRPSYAPAEMQTPMGSYLRDLDPYSVNISANGGESWTCMQQCGPIAIAPSAQASGRASDGAYNLEIVLPRFTVARLIGAPPGP